MTNHKTRVVLLFGGRSSEHSISCVTATGILQAIDKDRYEVLLVAITRQGSFVLVDEDQMTFTLDPQNMPEVAPNGTRVLWPENADTREFTSIDADGSTRSLGDVDVVFPLLHGLWGEDGTVQGLFELTSIPYVGSGVLGSALCMDKHVVKTVLSSAGIPVAPWHSITSWELERNPEALNGLDEGLTYPLFVKPARAGSSVGVSRITEPQQLEAALEIAFAEDHRVLIETGIVGREVEIAVLQSRGDAAPRTSTVLGEIVFDGKDFYDFDAKYMGSDGVALQLPAEVTEAEFDAIQSAAVLAFEVSQCAGPARIDFFLTEQGPILNEINTMPGFTPISMYPQLWQESGLGYSELVTELIELAAETVR